MNGLRVEPLPSGELVIAGIDSLLAACLYRIPEILCQREQPGVRERLFPDPVAGDTSFNADWHDHLDGELHYLFASAEETLVRDMARLDGDRLVIPAEHGGAWVSAINQARLVLGEQFRLTEADMDRGDLEPGNPRDLAAVQVHIYGWLMDRLLDATTGQ